MNQKKKINRIVKYINDRCCSPGNSAISGLIILLFVQPLKAQLPDRLPSLSLSQIWSMAESQNRQLKLSGLYLKETSITVLEAKDRLLPDLSLSGDLKLNSKFLVYDNGLFSAPQDVPVSNYGYNFGYNFNLNLFNGGKERRNINIRQEEEIRSQKEFALQKSNVKFAASVSYYDLYKFQQFREFILAEITAEKKQLSLITQLHKNGMVLKSDVLRTAVKLSQLELSRSDIEKKIELSKQRLNILMGRDDEAELRISDQNDPAAEDVADPGYAGYLKIALNQSPAYQLVNSDVKLSELNLRQVKAALLPKVSWYANYNYNYPQISFYPYSNELWGFGQTGIKVQFPLDNLYKSKHSIARAQVVNDQVKEKTNIKKDEISIQVKEAYLQQQQALESVETAEKNISKTTETVRVIRNSYLSQEALLTDLLEAENALLEARFNLTTAQINVKLSHIRLLVTVGIL